MQRVRWRRLVVMIMAFVLVVPVYWGQPTTVAQAVTLPVTQDLRVHGDFILVGNGVLTCSGSSCQQLLQGSTNQSYANDSINMVNNLQNAATGAVNSSSATLTIPSGAKVAYAELVWSANQGKISGTSGNYCSLNGTATIPTGSASTQKVMLTANGITTSLSPGTYTADAAANVVSGDPLYYSASVDVTGLLASLPSGSAQTITVGNVWAPTGLGCYGGWALEVVYDYGTYVMGNSNSILREVYTYDTYQRLTSGGSNAQISLTNLNVQGSNSRFAAVGWEGDASITGDTVTYTTSSSTSATPLAGPGSGSTNNYFQGYADGSVPFTAYPTTGTKFYNASVSASTSTLTKLAAGDTTLNVNLSTNGDSYLLTNAMISVPIADATIYKTAANGEADQAIAPGTAPTFRITVYNSGSVAVLGLSVNDPQAPDCNRTTAQLTALVQQTYPNGQVPSGGSVQYTCTGPATSTSLTNTASLTGQTPTGIPVGSTSGSKVEVATWNVAKTPSQPDVPVGGTATWTITVNNTGGADIYNVNIADPSLPGCAKTVSLLQAGQTLTYTCTSTITTTTTNTINVTGTAKASSTATITVPMTGTDSGTVYADAVTLAKTVDKSVVPIGGNATFTFTVKNTGTSTLNTVALADPDFPSCNRANVGPLAPGATTTVTCTVTPFAAASSSTLTNHATVTATPPSGTQITANSQVDVNNAALKLTKSAATTDTNGNGVLDAGDKVTYSFSVLNNGSVTLSAITVSDSKVASITCTPTTLASGATATCTASAPYTVLQTDVDAGTLVNTATATGTAPDGTKATSTASVTLTPVQQPAITLKKVASPTTVSAVGQVVTYTLTVTNSGNTTLSGVRPTDALAGLSALSCTVAGAAVTLPATLAPADVLTCTATRATTQTDLDNGRIANSASVSGTSPKSTVVTDTASAPVTATQTPSIDVTKTGSSTTFGAAGQQVTYTYTLKNTGNVSVTGAQLNDPMARLANKTCTPTQPAALLPGSTLSCTATLTITQADIDGGAIINTVTGTATPPSGATMTKQASWTLTPATAPKLDLTKSPSRTSITASGQAVVYTFTVTNSGNTTVNNVQVSDTLPGLAMGSCTPTAGSSLAPGAKMSCTGSYTSTQADVDAGKIVNNASATGTDSHGVGLTATASVTVTATAAPAITVAKSASPSVVNAVGQVVTYSFLVRNTGNVTLNSIVINDQLGGLSVPSCPATTLAPNATTTCTATRTTTQADLNTGSVSNTATASGTPPVGAAATSPGSTAKVTATQSPSFTIAKTPTPTTITAAGQTISYSIVVSNTGNVVLTNLRASDPRLATLTCTPVAAGGSLNPNQSTTCTGGYTATLADVNSGTINNTASATLTPPTGADITQTASAVVIASRQPSISITKSGSTSTFTKAGDVINYTITARNTGNVSLTSAQVTDPMFTAASPLTCTPSGAVTLTPGDSISCTGSHAVTQAEVDSGTLTNTATAKGTSPAGVNVTSTSSFTATATPNPSVGLTKTANPTTITAAGRAITYTMVLTNTGNVSLTNAQISDPKFASFSSCSPALGSKLAPGSAMTCTGTYTSTQADVDAGSILNTATASGTPPTGPAVGASTPAVVTVTKAPALTLAKSASPNRVNAVGQVVTYSFLVTNTGNVTATSVAVSDPLGGLSAISCPVTTLAPAASTTCTATRSTTQADLDAASGTLTNTATVSAKQTDGTAFPTVTSSTTVTMTQTPRLALTKSANPTTVSAVGDQVSYSMTLSNVGNVQVTNATITDNLVGTLTCSPANGSTLAPGTSITCTGTRAATQADLDTGSIRNTASGAATAPNGAAVQGVTAAATVTVTQSPTITLKKTADATTVNTVGQVVNYSYLVTNTGNVTVGALSIADPHSGLTPITCPATTLAPGASTTCFARYSITQGDLNSGSVLDTATASTERPGGDPNNANDNVTATDSAVVGVAQNPALTFTKTANITSFSTVGRSITYTFSTTNSGNVDIKNVQVADTLAGLSALSCTPALGSTLAPGASMGCTATYSTTQADLDRMSIVNNATATGLAPDGSTVTRTATRTIPATLAPNLSFTKSANPATVTAPGQTVTYTFSVQNTGNVTMHGIAVSDTDLPGLSGITCLATDLAPTASTTCSATYTTIQADIDRGSIANSATLTGLDPSGATTTRTAAATVQVTQTPRLALTKTASPATVAAVGTQVTYTFHVTNTGNVTVSSLAITDAHVGLSAISCQATTLAPGISTDCSASYTTTQADLDNGHITNTATAGGLTPGATTVTSPSATATVNATQTPSRTFTKTVSPLVVNAVGQVVNYSLSVVNTGNVTLGNVYIADPSHQTGQYSWTCNIYNTGSGSLLRPGSGPVSLAPGETKTCTAVYSVTQADLDAGSILNTATVTSTAPDGSAMTPLSASAVVTSTQSPALVFTKTADLPTYSAVGQKVTYTFQLTNSGNVTVTNPQISDPHAGLSALSCTPALGTALAPKAQLKCTATYTVTQADIDNRTIGNTASAAAGAPDGTTLSQTATASIPATLNPAATLSKVASPNPVATVGSTVTYSFVVRNTGNDTLSSIVVNDPLVGLSPISCPVTTLAPATSTTCTATITLTQAQADAAAVPNTATLSASDPAGTPVSARASTTLRITQNPQLTVAKSASPTSVQKAGDQVTYTFVVTNTGNVTVNQIALNDPLIGSTPITCPQASLAPTASMTCQATYAVDQQEVDAGKVTNVATATGTTSSGATVPQAQGTATVTIPSAPAWTFTKTADTTQVTRIGQTVTYTLTVVNTGNVTLQNVFISDAEIGTPALFNCWVDHPDGTRTTAPGPIPLEPGATKVCHGSKTFAQSDFEVADPNPATTGIDWVNTASVTATTPDGTQLAPLSSSATVYLQPSPDFLVTKTANSQTYSHAGQVITYTVQAKNTGNVALSNVRIQDQKLAGVTLTCSPVLGSTLQPQQSMTCSGQYTVTQDDVDAGSITNLAYGVGTDPQGVEHTSTAPGQLVLTWQGTKDIALSKTASPAAVNRAGDLVTYTFTVDNPGDVTLDDVVISDPMTGLSAINCPSTSVGPGASMNCTATYTVTQTDIDNEGFDNTATVDADAQGTAVTTTASTKVLASHQYSMTLSKTGTIEGGKTAVTAVGDVIDYSFLVTNTGNVALDNIAITDKLPVTQLSCPATTLAPLASMTCTAEYSVTQTDLNQANVVNTATVSGEDMDGNAATANATASNPTKWTPAMTLAKTASPTTVSAVGQTVTYTVVAKNTGNVTLYNVVIADPITGLSKFSCGALTGPVTLDPGGVKSCTATRQVTQADLDAGSIPNTANVTSTLPNGATGPRVESSYLVGVTQSPALTVTKVVDQPTYSHVGDYLGYTITVTNSGNVSLAKVQVADSLPGITNLSCTPAMGTTLAGGAGMSCTGDYAVTQADLDAKQVTNVATATGVGPGAATITGTSPEAVSKAVLASSINLVKTADTTTYDHAGQVITYTLRARNTGNATLTGVQITEALANVSTLDCDQPQPASLAPEAVLTCTATYTVTQADLDTANPDLNVGITNAASVVGTDPAGTQVKGSAAVTINAVHKPALSMLKTATPTTYSAVGQTITYSFLVTNTGNVQVHDIALNDPLVTNATCPDTSLEPGASTTCTGTLTVDQHMLDSGSVPNTATVFGSDPDNNTTTQAQSSTTVTATQSPSISLAKTGDPGTVTAVGQIVTFTVTATNTGNVTLGNVFVADPIPNHSTFVCVITQTAAGGGGTRNGTGPVSLAPGEIKTCHATYAATQADIDKGSIPNTANVTAVSGSTNLRTEASWVTDVTQQPALGVTKTVDQTTYGRVGQKLTYGITVTNTGNTTAANVQVSDAMQIDGLTCVPQLGSALISGQVMTCSGTHTITQADLDAKSLTNVATATASDPNGGAIGADSNEVTSTATLQPSITLHKDADPTTVTAAGQLVTYTFTATNTGNTTLSNVTIDEPMTGVSAIDCSPATAPYSIAPGDDLTCTATYTTTQGDIDSADPDKNIGISNTASVTGTAPDGATATATGAAQVAVTHAPAVSLTKTASPLTYSKVGDVTSYKFVIKNTGNVSLHGFNLADPVPGLSAFTCDADLATAVIEPQGTITCTASRSIQQAGLDNGRVDNTATVTAVDPDSDQPVTGSGSAEVTAVQRPSMTLTKAADRTTVSAVGDLVTYTVTMTNTGNVTLSNVFVADPLAGHATFACTITAVDGTTRAGTGPVTVYPGEVKTCTTTRATTQADLDAGSILNTAHVDATTPNGTSVPTVDSNPVVVQAIQQPAILLVKSVSPRRPAAVGDTLTYGFTISNPGTVTVSNLSLSDPAPGLSGFTCDSPLGQPLAPGDEIHCTATTQTTTDQMNQPTIDNTATVTADAPTSPVSQVTSSSSAEAIPVHHPSLSLTKTHDVTTVTAAGQKVVYSFTVTNTGNIAVADIAVSDDLPGVSAVVCDDTSLPVGGSTTCTASYTATQADIDRGHIDNTATVTGVDPVGGDPVTPGEAQDQVKVTQNPHLAITKTPITPAPVNLGDDAQFRVAVTNDGTTTLTNVQVDDPATNLTALTCTPAKGATLAPGDSMTCTAHLKVVQADIDAGTVANTATVTGTDPNGTTLPPVGANAEIKTIVGTPSAIVTKTPSPTTVGKAGDVITYTFTVQNTGTVSLNTPTLTDALPGLMNLTCDHDSATPLPPGVTMTCTATYTLLQSDADAGHVDNLASFDAVVPPTMTAFRRTAAARTQVTQSPSLSLSKTADRSQVQAVGDPVVYTFVVRNTGNVGVDFLQINDERPIGALSCVDAVGASVSLPTRLAPSGQLVCQATYLTTQADLDKGSILNSAKATGTTDLGTAVASSVASTVVGVNQNPQVELTKTADTTLVQKVGDKVTYTITAKNTGNVTVSNAQVTDPMPYDSFSCTPAQGSDLAPEATMTCTGVYSVVHTDLEHGSISNVATFSGADPNGASVEQTAGTTVPALYNPKLSLQKTVSGPTNWVAGDTLTYRYTIENIGNMDAYYFVGSDTMVGLTFLGCWLNDQPSDPMTAVLHPGESSYCLATKQVTQADVDRGSLTNTVTSVALEATGQQFPPVTATTTTSTDLTGDFTITKTPDVATYNRVGQLITYRFVATNTSQLTLSSASFVESLAGISAPSCDRASVAPGASANCTATYSITQADLDRGYINNTVDLTARDAHGAVIGPRRGAARIDAVQTAQLTLTKQALASAVNRAGETVQFTLSSLNSGNVTLHDVTIADLPANATITGCDQAVPATLAPNSALNCTVDYVVSQDDINRGRVLNTATSDALDPSGTAVKQATASSTVPAQRNPGVKLTKTADLTTVDTLGQTVTFTLTATNTGNTTIFNTRMADPLPGLTIGTCTPAQGGSLDPGQVMTCTATYNATQPDLNTGHIDNTATVTGNNLGGDPATPDVTDSASRTVGVTMKPALSLKKTANVTTVSALSDPVVYTFVVTNTGNVSLHDVTVTDPLTAQGMGPISCPSTTLDPTHSMTCSATFYPAQQDLDRGYIPNTATAKGLSPTGSPATEGVGSTRVEVTQKPAYALTKTADHTDVTKAGEQVLYTFVGTNTGNVTLSNVTVSDPLPGLQTMDCYPRQPADLPPGATIICRAFYTVTQADLDAGTLVNTATINGTDPQGTALDPVEAHETIRTVVHSELEVDKTTAATGFDRAGDVISYTLTAKNLGNQTIHDVLVTDLADGASAITCTSNDGSTFPMPDPTSPLELEPETAVQCTVSYAITQADMDAGQFTNTARMTALDPTDVAITPATGSVTVVGAQKPAISVAKTASPATVAAVGEQVTYTIVTTNTGNVSLHGLTVSDPMTGLSTIECPTDPAETTLAPRESLSCTATYTITQADLDAGTLRNPVSATGIAPSGATMSASGEATVDVTAKPSLTLTKTADATGPLSQGETVNYTVTLTNDGNQTAFVRSIADPMAGPAGAPDALACDVTLPASLAPGAPITCHLAHVVTTDEALSGSVSNSATAVATAPSGTPISIAPAVVTEVTTGTPSAEVVKEAVLHDTNGNGTGQPGEVVSYTITGTNTGDVTLRGVSVSDPMLPSMTCSPSASTALSLAPGETVVCTGSHTITAAEARAGELTNTASLGSSDLASAAVVSVAVKVAPTTAVTPQNPSNPPIADTGSPVSPWLLALGIACTLGGALLLIGRRRRS